MTVEELLLELKDIQPPLEPAWWLIAPAYWIAIFTLLVLAAGIWHIFRRRKANHLASLADRELQRIRSLYTHNDDTRWLAIELSKWLRQVSILAFPTRHLQSLNGRGWLEFLDETLGSNGFSDGIGQVFGNTIYSKQVTLEAAPLVQLCEQWLLAIKPHLRQRGND